MKILNLFSGLGGNRKPWKNCHVVAIENNQQIARYYLKRFPGDTVIIADAYEYLLEHYDEFDFIWVSPPCKTHSRLNIIIDAKRDKGFRVKLPDLRIYSTIFFLRRFFKGLWVVENVRPYYDPLIKPTFKLGRHVFWSNFHVPPKEFKHREYFNRGCDIAEAKEFDLSILKGFKGSRRDRALRNLVHPGISAHIMKHALGKKTRQELLI